MVGMCPNLSDQTQYRLNKINKIKEYFIAKICETEAMSKGLSKYITAFGYFDKVLVALSATSAGVSIASVASDIGAPVGILIASFTFTFSITTGIMKNF